jgi:hypothetical protein
MINKAFPTTYHSGERMVLQHLKQNAIDYGLGSVLVLSLSLSGAIVYGSIREARNDNSVISSPVYFPDSASLRDANMNGLDDIVLRFSNGEEVIFYQTQDGQFMRYETYEGSNAALDYQLGR